MKRATSSVSISAQLKAFLESGVSVVVGTRDADLVPEITRAWGLVVSKDRKSISLCLPLATSHKTLDNLAGNGQVAVCCSLPTSYKTVQLKGQCLETRDPGDADLAAVGRHRVAFGRLNKRIGFPRQHSETFWRREIETSPDLVKLRFLPEQIFDQTPGPDAGSPL
jgi:hypothetical protein